MIVEVLVLCDNAQNYNNKLIVVGTFNEITVKQLPFNYTFSLACRLLFNEEDLPGKKQIKIALKDDKGKVLVPVIETSIDIPNIKEDGYTANMVVGFGNILFNSTGKYIVQFTLDNFYRELPIYVKELPEIKSVFNKIQESQ